MKLVPEVTYQNRPPPAGKLVTEFRVSVTDEDVVRVPTVEVDAMFCAFPVYAAETATPEWVTVTVPLVGNCLRAKGLFDDAKPGLS